MISYLFFFIGNLIHIHSVIHYSHHNDSSNKQQIEKEMVESK